MSLQRLKRLDFGISVAKDSDLTFTFFMTKNGIGISPRIPGEDIHLMLYSKNDEIDIHLTDRKRLPAYHPPIIHQPVIPFWQQTLEHMLHAGFNSPYPAQAKAFLPSEYGLGLLDKLRNKSAQFSLKSREASIKLDLVNLLEEFEAQRTDIAREGTAEDIRRLPEPYRFGVTPELRLLTVHGGAIVSHPTARQSFEPMLARFGIVQLFNYLRQAGLENAFFKSRI